MKVFLRLALVVSFLAFPAFAQQDSRDKGLTRAKPDTRPPARVAADASRAAPCDGANYTTDAYENGVFMGGPMVGWAWTPAINATVTRIEVFTGESTSLAGLAIWSDDGGSPSKPLANLGDTGYFNLVQPVSWQGGNLSTPVTVNTATKYWVMFDPSGGEQGPVQTGVGQTYWGTSAGNISTPPPPASWSGPFSFPDRAWKFRVFCQVRWKDVYAVKFVCGNFMPKPDDRVEPPVKPGNYLTAINVHNPNPGLIAFRKKAVLLYWAERPPQPEEPQRPGKLHDARLEDDWGLEIDCFDIRSRLLEGMIPPGGQTFIKGWVIIEVAGTGTDPEPRPLDVTAVYTSHGWNMATSPPSYNGFAEDVEAVTPKRVKY